MQKIHYEKPIEAIRIKINKERVSFEDERWLDYMEKIARTINLPNEYGLTRTQLACHYAYEETLAYWRDEYRMFKKSMSNARFVSMIKDLIDFFIAEGADFDHQKALDFIESQLRNKEPIELEVSCATVLNNT